MPISFNKTIKDGKLIVMPIKEETPVNTEINPVQETPPSSEGGEV